MDVIIALDSYDDLFDDFDIRRYSERAISTDFLAEVRRRIKNAEGVRMILTLPKSKRRRSVEKKIIKRLREFFGERAEHFRRKAEGMLKKGLLYITIGGILLGIIVALESMYENKWGYLLTSFLFVPSWFFVWSGLEKIVEEYPKLREVFLFYSKLSKARIKFDEEEKYED